jgi:signal transduction histidine kinase
VLDDLLTIEVADDGGDASVAAGSGTSTGLDNVRARVEARREEGAAFRAGPRFGGGFCSSVTLPLRRAP